jgi:hypothetical protein
MIIDETVMQSEAQRNVFLLLYIYVYVCETYLGEILLGMFPW